ncbi:uncharacterized protein LOC119406362 [Rhipicephalus sanguineus]|uniref:uncharacterized protein LOC119406362 n=1 Tax=Rhipicephalus sanguineus TaxID=34632 RepID=UPI0020C49B5D|nr:uncharacterized protein LOC119406362 [Rhipicephalus sanguineus]
MATHVCDYNGYRGSEMCIPVAVYYPPLTPGIQEQKAGLSHVFCAVINVAAGKAPLQSSTVAGGLPQKAVDGSTSAFFTPDTCSLTEPELSPWWYVNLLEPYVVQLVRIDWGRSSQVDPDGATVANTVVVRVGNNRPDLGANPVCNRFAGPLEEGRPLFLPCAAPMPGAFVSIHLEGPAPLSLCEVFVYTDQALPVERCPSFRDQPLGSAATYHGKCYAFYNNQPAPFEAARRFCEQRGGSLVDETSPALQGFLSWELYRRHRHDGDNGQYWMGATRDPRDPTNWRWINGREVTISFWNSPTSSVPENNCSRFDGNRGWLWSDTNCDHALNFICQHRPTTCGKPSRPPNSTLIARDFDVGSVVEYRCSPGHLLVGPNIRTCLANGFYSEFAPKCRYLECGPPAPIPNGSLDLINGTRHYLSAVEYRCREGFVLIGRSLLVCDVDQRWNGPPPRCEPVMCRPPPAVAHGLVRLSAASTIFGTVAEYDCEPGYQLSGNPHLLCGPTGFWQGDVPVCLRPTTPRPVITTTTTTTTTTTEEPPPPPQINGHSAGGNEGPAIVPTRFHPDFMPDRPDQRPTFVTTTVASPRPSATATVRATQRPRPQPTTPSQPPRRPAFRPVDHDVAGSSGHRTVLAPPDLHNSFADDSAARAGAKLNMGGFIALGVFGGFVVLAAVITIVVIVIRRTVKCEQAPPRPPCLTQQSDQPTNLGPIPSHHSARQGDCDGVDRCRGTKVPPGGSSGCSSLEHSPVGAYAEHGLQRHYKRAWENLRYDAGAAGHKAPRIETLDHPHVVSASRTLEGYREANEITVNDVAALYGRPHRR